MRVFDKEFFTKKQIEAVKAFEKARKQLTKCGLVLNCDAGQLNIYRKSDWMACNGFPRNVTTFIDIDEPCENSTDC